MAHQRILIEGTPTGGETVSVTVNDVTYEHTARKSDSPASIALALAEKFNRANSNTTELRAGPITDGFKVWSNHNWPTTVAALSDDEALKVSVVPE